ncbi:MAG: hypothetical protein ACREU3_16840, partial [Steroidobacteraceae bacterium]
MSLRAAGAKYQQSENGRRNHAERQRLLRVTHQAYSPVRAASAIVGAVSLGEAAIHETAAVDGDH